MSTADRPPLSLPSSTTPPVYGTHLEREIQQQPSVWRELARSIRGLDLEELLGPVLEAAGGRILLAGAGTSAYVGQVVAPHLTRVLGRQVEAVATTDLVANPLDILIPDVPTLLVSFARSGNSPESLAACDLADRLLSDVSHLVLTCDPDGALARAHDGHARSCVVLMPPATDDQSFAMTSSFTSMTLAALLLLEPREDHHEVAEVAARAAEQVLGQRARLADLAERVHDRVVYLGSGSLAGLARECALKLTEVTAGRVLGLPESSLGFRHGPKAALTPQTLALVLVSSDPYVRRYDLDILAELAEALPPGQTVAISNSSLVGDVSDVVEVLSIDADPREADAFLALPMVLVAQILALETAGRRGLNPDLPFPNGEVNRVVRGVEVYSLDTATAPAD